MEPGHTIKLHWTFEF